MLFRSSLSLAQALCTIICSRWLCTKHPYPRAFCSECSARKKAASANRRDDCRERLRDLLEQFEQCGALAKDGVDCVVWGNKGRARALLDVRECRCARRNS